jgi:cysteine desulfurase/selenocysteine lyase
MAEDREINLTTSDIRKDFPQLQQISRGKPITYLDSAATTLKPAAVLETLSSFYGDEYATIHRGAYLFSEKATERYERVRKKIAALIGSKKSSEIIFTAGTTESINLVANTYGLSELKKDDLILISAMEHHSNIVPWQMLRDRIGVKIEVIPMDDRGVLDQENYDELLKKSPKLVCFNHVSNALGTINPVKDMVAKAKAVGAVTLVDGAQSIAHVPVDVLDWDCDFFVFSGHKLYGPTGVGVLYGKLELLKAMPPWQGGGDMIHSVSFEETTYAAPPARFEAGTPPIAEVIGLGAAIDWIQSYGLENLEAAELEIQDYALAKLEEIDGLRLIGTSPKRAGAISFMLAEAHPHDIATIVDGFGISLRAGHHCAQPVMTRFGIPATARASLGAYTTCEDIDRLVEALNHVNEIFRA